MILLNDLVKGLPPTLRTRVAWGSHYVAEYVKEREKDLPVRRRMERDKLNALQVIFTVWLLERFLRDGTRAAEQAVSAFAELRTPGFQIGKAAFTEGSEEVKNGERLADGLRAVIAAPEWFALLDRAETVAKAVEAAYEELRYG